MKKKIRNITVNDVDYVWRTYRYNGDGDGGIGVKIWHDKKVIVDKWYTSYDSITPATIKELILEKDET